MTIKAFLYYNKFYYKLKLSVMRKSAILLVWMMIYQSLSICGQYNGSQITGENLQYTTASIINSSTQLIILNIYRNLIILGNYSIDLEYNIYTNISPKCNKNNSSVIRANYNEAIWLCFDQFYPIICNQLWKLTIKCGTIVQIHKPFDSNVIVSMNVQDASWIIDSNGLKMINIDLSMLCAGLYHLWFVYYSRLGTFLKGVKPIYIVFPSCNC